MICFDELKTKKVPLCVVGLGYVGLPLAVQFAKHFSVIGFDINAKRIQELENNLDHTKEVSVNDLKSVQIEYSSNPQDIKKAQFIVVAVPTPVSKDNLPDLALVEKATETVAKNLSPGSVVVYESTVYPGVTEDICLPILEKFSGLKNGVDFKIGYSPERVNPGDKEHTINKVTKVVSGQDEESLSLIADVYGTITNTFKATSIRVAEAAKVIENTQRDLNIALMNELAIIFPKMNFSVYDVLDAAGTKWNFLKFKPGMVGGHCIGVDPYYLTYKAEKMGYHPEVILSGRKINDSMAQYITGEIIKKMFELGKSNNDSKVAILGFTFKENIPDIRNSKVFDMYKEFKSAGLTPLVYDPEADVEETKREYGIELCKFEDLKELDTIVLAVPHKKFLEMSASDYKQLMNSEKLLIADVKRILNKQEIESLGMNYWTL